MGVRLPRSSPNAQEVYVMSPAKYPLYSNGKSDAHSDPLMYSIELPVANRYEANDSGGKNRYGNNKLDDPMVLERFNRPGPDAHDADRRQEQKGEPHQKSMEMADGVGSEP